MTAPVLAVFGTNGQIGRALAELGPPPGWTLVGFDRDRADITDAEAVRRALAEMKTGVVVNAAAYTAVDRAEAEPELAYAVNRDGAGNVAAAAAERGLPVIHFSTDYVFDGTRTSAYGEDDPVHPLSVYGASKWAGEEAVRAAHARHLILRTAWVFAPFGSNFVRTMLQLAAERDSLRVVADQTGCPTSAHCLAEAVLALAPRLLAGEGFGTFHHVGAPAISWHGFAAAIFQRLAREGRKVPSLEAITTEQYPTPAQRPACSILSGAKLAAVHGIQPPDWREGLDLCLDRLLATTSGG
jgi:dTDP-4-dehydrorhamnose reductase